MEYSVDIERSIEALAFCFQKVSKGINDIYDWDVRVNAGGIDYGIYFNFDLERKELEVSNQPSYGYDNSLGLDEIIDKINGCDDEEGEEED